MIEGLSTEETRSRMFADGFSNEGRHKTRRELLRQYVVLQRDLLNADPSSAAYESTIHAFRQMGYALITSGFEDDLDRLLRLRVLDGGQAVPRPHEERQTAPELQVVERRQLL